MHTYGKGEDFSKTIPVILLLLSLKQLPEAKISMESQLIKVDYLWLHCDCSQLKLFIRLIYFDERTLRKLIPSVGC